MPGKTKLDVNIEKNLNTLLQGNVLAIDPASGASSMPGYACFEAGTSTEWGVIQVKPSSSLHRRLHYLVETMRKDFTKPDLLLVEHIPDRGHGRHATAHSSLMKAVGAIISVWNCKLIEVPIPTWKAYLRNIGDDDYKEKRDDLDALMIGRCVMQKARNFKEATSER